MLNISETVLDRDIASMEMEY